MSSGIIGIFKGADPLKAIIRLVVCAGLVLIAKKAGIPMSGYDAMAVTLLLGVAALGAEYFLSKEMTRCYIERHVFPMVVFGALWCCALSYAMFQWSSAASENEGEKIRAQKAAYTQSSRADAALSMAQTNAANAGKKVENLRRAAWEAIPKVSGREVTSVAEARQLVDAAKQHRWWSYTEECTKPKGKESQAYCGIYREAAAAVPAAEQRDLTLKLLAEAEAEHKQLQAAYVAQLGNSGSVRIEASDKLSDLHLLMKYGGLDEETAADVSALSKLMVVSLFLSGLGVMSEIQRHRDTPRRPWPWSGLLRRAIWGAKSSDPNSYRREEDAITHTQPHSAPVLSAVPPTPAPQRASVGDLNRDRLRRILEANTDAGMLRA